MGKKVKGNNKLKGKTAALLDKACALNRKAKEIKKELDPIKDELKDILHEGEYISKSGACRLSLAEQYEPINPVKLQALLKKKRKGKEFIHHVSVVVKGLEAVLTPEEIEKLRVKRPYKQRKLTLI